MDTAAIAISVVSLLIATFGLGWNIYRDILLKARVKIFIAIRNLYFEGAPPSPPYIGITATNHAPGKIILQSIDLRDTTIFKKLLKKERFATVFHDYKNPYSGKLSCTLEVGESLSLFLIHEKDSFLKEQFSHVGINDSFGRTHWTPRKSVKSLNRKLERFF